MGLPGKATRRGGETHELENSNHHRGLTMTDVIKDIYAEVKKRGIPHSNHESDLYLWVNEETADLVNRYEFSGNVTTFISMVDNKPMYDIPFQYPIHEIRAAANRKLMLKG